MEFIPLFFLLFTVVICAIGTSTNMNKLKKKAESEPLTEKEQKTLNSLKTMSTVLIIALPILMVLTVILIWL